MQSSKQHEMVRVRLEMVRFLYSPSKKLSESEQERGELRPFKKIEIGVWWFLPPDSDSL
jgi:hypothetical protein